MNRKTLTLLITAAVLATGVIAYAVWAQNDATQPSSTAELSLSEATSTVAAADETTTVDLPLTHRQELAAAEAATESGDDKTADSTEDVDGDSGSSSSEPNDKTDTDKKDDGGSDGDDEPAQPVTLTVEERQACYWDLIAAEDRAVAEAEKAYPMDDENADLEAHVKLRLELQAKYQGEVAEEFGITAKQAEAILEEGANNSWPMPPLPE